MELDHSRFCCSVCLELLKDPVTVPCGHNYCTSCIKGCWDRAEKERGQYRCPQCRETFSPRPDVRRNNMLDEVVEMLKRTSSEQASPRAAAACAGPADVACDFCCGTKRNKATTSCLTCLASYCPAHLEPHYSVPVLKKHELVSATVPLQEKMCTKHNKLKEVYCQTDRKCICCLCVIDEHKRHHIVSAAAERAVQQKQLIVSRKKVQERFQERERELKMLVQALRDFKTCGKTAVKTSDEIFDELISITKKIHSLTNYLIKEREKTAVAQAKELQLQLEEEITKLRRRDTELERLSHMDDHIHFIQTFSRLQSPSTSCESADLPPDSVIRPQRSFRTVTDCMTKLKDDMRSLLYGTWWAKISDTVSTIDVVLPPVPNTREEFLRYCRPLTLDKNSAHRYLSLSQEYQRVTSGSSDNYHSAHSDRFATVRQVLCREGLSERCYWEVRTGGSNVSVAMSYKDISRSSAYDSEFGSNNKSWSLECSPHGYAFRHNKGSVTVSGPRSYRIGVYLDYKAGTLSFYSISLTMTLLHKEHARFTQPLHPGLGLKDDVAWPSSGYSAELIKLW